MLDVVARKVRQLPTLKFVTKAILAWIVGGLDSKEGEVALKLPPDPTLGVVVVRLVAGRTSECGFEDGARVSKLVVVGDGALKGV